MGRKSTTGRTPGAEYIGTNRRRVDDEKEARAGTESDQTPVNPE